MSTASYLERNNQVISKVSWIHPLCTMNVGPNINDNDNLFDHVGLPYYNTHAKFQAIF